MNFALFPIPYPDQSLQASCSVGGRRKRLWCSEKNVFFFNWLFTVLIDQT